MLGSDITFYQDKLHLSQSTEEVISYKTLNNRLKRQSTQTNYLTDFLIIEGIKALPSHSSCVSFTITSIPNLILCKETI